MNAPQRILEIAPAHVEVTPGAAATEYRIKGELPAVFQAIAAVFQQYNAVGYGTMVHTVQADYPSDERYIARMSRSNSCD